MYTRDCILKHECKSCALFYIFDWIKSITRGSPLGVIYTARFYFIDNFIHY